MALREAGESYHDLNGGDPDVSAKAAGHSKETKARRSGGGGFEISLCIVY